MYALAFKLKQLNSCLNEWNKQQFRDVFQSMREKEDLVQKKETQYENAHTEEIRTEFRLAQAQLLLALKNEEDYWQQKARVKWLKEGDGNTRFLHASIQERRNRLRINRIKNAEGAWIEDEDQIG